MGLATVDPQSLKEHTEIYKIPKFGVNRPNSKQFKNSKSHSKMSKFTEKCMACRTAVRQAIHFFVYFDIFKWLYLAYYGVYLHQTWGFCKSRCALSDYVDQ